MRACLLAQMRSLSPLVRKKQAAQSQNAAMKAVVRKKQAAQSQNAAMKAVAANGERRRPFTAPRRRQSPERSLTPSKSAALLITRRKIALRQPPKQLLRRQPPKHLQPQLFRSRRLDFDVGLAEATEECRGRPDGCERSVRRTHRSLEVLRSACEPVCARRHHATRPFY